MAGVMVTGVTTTMWSAQAAKTGSAKPGKAQLRHIQQQSRDLSQVFGTVLDRYVEPVDPEALVSTGLKQMVGTLDPHSYYLTAEERRLAQASARRGANTGLSVLLTDTGSEEQQATIVQVKPGSAAEKAKLNTGDRILRINGRKVDRFLNQAEVELAMLGKEGEVLSLWIQPAHESQPRPAHLRIQASKVEPDISFTRIGSGSQAFLHAKIRSFRSGTASTFVNRLKSERTLAGGTHLPPIVLDLRGNPGGDVGEALIIADQFINEGVLVRTRGRGGELLREEIAHTPGTDSETSLVVLVDRHSASASELLAVALQEHQRAKVVGETTFGKGTVQEVIGMKDGGLLTLTVAKYYSPKNRSVHGVGVEPDDHLPRAQLEDEKLGVQAAALHLQR